MQQQEEDQAATAAAPAGGGSANEEGGEDAGESRKRSREEAGMEEEGETVDTVPVAAGGSPMQPARKEAAIHTYLKKSYPYIQSYRTLERSTLSNPLCVSLFQVDPNSMFQAVESDDSDDSSDDSSNSD